MEFSAVNWLAIIAAAVLGWLFGAVWYTALSKPWLKAVRIDPTTMRNSVMPFVIGFVGLVVMAFVLSLVIPGMTGGEPSVVAGIVLGFVLWLGFVATTLTVNHRYQGFGWALTAIDSGHWLGAMLIMGAVIGWFGAPAS